ncbi:hypothetical protein MHU86_8006 [Fragilaria crotonensis]|nr:hypothetical protein MHU86_8006 [Fragilaria crotonensis]
MDSTTDERPLGTDGAGGFAAAMAVDTKQVVERHIGTPFDWSRMLVSGVSTGATREAEPAAPCRLQPEDDRRKEAERSTGRSQASQSKREDDTDDVTVVGFTMKPTVPVPAFIAAAIMDTYVTAPEELALLIVNAIKQRASEDPDPSRATIRGGSLLHPAVGPQRSGKLEEDPGPTKRGVAASNAYSKRSDEWAKSLHLKHLAVRARSLIRTDDHASTPGRTEDAIRNLSTLLERQAANAATRPPNVEDRL